ncbi:hypothetical protein [Vreelandella janggokensis]|uniref:hypothetical protein n=1 Tax=Vreelandella janggokensis TaxID=370767 RepID=UPI002863DF1B|nr:hypothetical protein [Halomonas janggokensis]MDR5887538.1 hypothetical protein [Halomonas janggokensis]
MSTANDEQRDLDVANAEVLLAKHGLSTPCAVLRPAPEVVQREWEKRCRRQKSEAAFATKLSDLQQWQLEVQLGQLIKQATLARESAEESEIKALKARWDEAEALESISECRKCLGLTDGPIGQLDGRDDDA